jgi:hypothetical protein
MPFGRRAGGVTAGPADELFKRRLIADSRIIINAQSHTTSQPLFFLYLPSQKEISITPTKLKKEKNKSKETLERIRTVCQHLGRSQGQQ